MDERNESTANAGRKGVAYDWHDLYVAAQTAGLDDELRVLLSVPG
jgi:hypothetical protein